MAKEKKLNAFMVSYGYHEAHSENNEVQVRNVVIVAYDKKEAGDMFIEWLFHKDLYERVDGVVVQKMRKTKKNARFFTKEFYDKQVMFIYNHDEYVKLYHGENYKDGWKA